MQCTRHATSVHGAAATCGRILSRGTLDQQDQRARFHTLASPWLTQHTPAPRPEPTGSTACSHPLRRCRTLPHHGTLSGSLRHSVMPCSTEVPPRSQSAISCVSDVRDKIFRARPQARPPKPTNEHKLCGPANQYCHGLIFGTNETRL